MRTGSRFSAHRPRGARSHERGATLVIGALMMVALVAFVGLAIDVGMVFNERRQEQSAVDTAALSGGRTAMLDGGSDSAVFDEVTRISHQNMDDPPSLTEWRSRFEQGSCSDPGRVAAGYTVPLAVPGRGTIDCISFNPARSQIRVRLPDTELDTVFARVVGHNRWEVSAFAEAGLAEGDGGPNIIPFAMSAAVGDSGYVCLKSPSNGQAPAECGSYQGNFNYIDIKRPTWTSGGFGGCGTNNTTNRMIENTARGIDHFLQVRQGTWPNLSGSRIEDTCANITAAASNPSLRPNHMRLDTGNVTTGNCGNADPNAMAKALIANVPLSDGLGGRLTRIPPVSRFPWVAGWPTTTVRCGGRDWPGVDNRPIWDFLDLGIGNGGTVSYTGAVGQTTPSNANQAPLRCAPSYINGFVDKRAKMLECLSDYSIGNYTVDLFNKDSDGDGTYDIAFSPRFTWVPQSHTNLAAECNGSNDPANRGYPCFPIREFRPVFIHSTFMPQGNNLNEWQAGNAPPTSTGTSVDGMSGFAIDMDMLPDTLRANGPRYPYSLSGMALIR